jgi:hypothetical protein
MLGSARPVGIGGQSPQLAEIWALHELGFSTIELPAGRVAGLGRRGVDQ